MSPDQAREIARGNIERNLDPGEYATADTIFDEAYTLAFDALADSGCPLKLAREIAQEIAQGYAQP
jgi:hypothetical protein